MFIAVIAVPWAYVAGAAVVGLARAVTTTTKAKQVALRTLDFAQFYVGLHLGTNGRKRASQVIDARVLGLEALKVRLQPHTDVFDALVNNAVQIRRELRNPEVLGQR